MSRHGLGAASALDKGYSPECVEGVFSEVSVAQTRSDTSEGALDWHEATLVHRARL
jgi:hypothetical protein